MPGDETVTGDKQAVGDGDSSPFFAEAAGEAMIERTIVGVLGTGGGVGGLG